jgi:hypothetical protein
VGADFQEKRRDAPFMYEFDSTSRFLDGPDRGVLRFWPPTSILRIGPVRGVVGSGRRREATAKGPRPPPVRSIVTMSPAGGMAMESDRGPGSFSKGSGLPLFCQVSRQ